MTLRRWIRRLERDAEEEMIEVRQADGTVARFHVWELVGAWQEEMTSRAAREAGEDEH
jgi:hypothetical protein